MTAFVPDVDLAAENADLQARLDALEAVALELIEERDRAIKALERATQQALFAEDAS